MHDSTYPNNNNNNKKKSSNSLPHGKTLPPGILPFHPLLGGKHPRHNLLHSRKLTTWWPTRLQKLWRWWEHGSLPVSLGKVEVNPSIQGGRTCLIFAGDFWSSFLCTLGGNKTIDFCLESSFCWPFQHGSASFFWKSSSAPLLWLLQHCFGVILICNIDSLHNCHQQRVRVVRHFCSRTAVCWSGLTSGLWNFTFHKCSSQGCCCNLTNNKCSFDIAIQSISGSFNNSRSFSNAFGKKKTQGPIRLIHKALQRPHCARSVHWFRTHPLRVFWDFEGTFTFKKTQLL